MSWKGTPVPNSGIVEKIYFNTSLNKQEVQDILKNITNWEIVIGMEVAYIYKHPSIGEIFVLKSEDGYAILANKFFGNNNGIFSPLSEENNGWNSVHTDANALSPLIVNGENQTTFTENDKLSSLFSITPFEEVKEVTLDSWAEDIADAIREKKSTTNKIPRLNFAQEIRSIEGGGSGIIEVDELPTENIDENAIYKARTPLKNVYVVNSANNILGPAIDVGVYVYYVEEVDTTPTDNIKHSAIGDMIGLYIYHIKDINDLKVYIDAGAGLNWYSVGELFTLKSITGMTYKGKILESEISDTLEDGYYLYAKEDYYKFENSSWVKINKSNSLPPVSITLENSTDSGANYYLEVYCQLGKYFGSDDFSATYQIYVDNILNSIQLTYGREEYFGCSISNISAGEHNIKIYFKLSKKDGTLDFEETWFEQTATFTIES